MILENNISDSFEVSEFITYTTFYGNCLDTKKQRNTTFARNGIQWTMFKQLEYLDFAEN